MENDAKNVTIRELRREEEMEARGIVVSGLYRQIVTLDAACKIMLSVIQLKPSPWQVYIMLGLLMAIFYAVSNSVLVSVGLTAVFSIPSSWGLLYCMLWLYVHEARRELDHLYSYYNDKAGSRFWVAVCGGKIAGTVALDRTSDTVAELKRMSVLPEYRRRGVATRLMKRFEEFCRSDGVKETFLTTSFVQLEAVRLYQKCGFVISNTTEVGFRLEKMM
ncbi:N-acetyltransferase 14-like [Branchiostoma floridae]|uniref:N-acetyltransferase 14-like n=2 Tax=Branchiostoma floridae TaxID=7739 RepID=A0A9J7LSB4_BRAFL|nr:N-acetyltransferase 14-like [Branchiostoma floridae]